jgi:hypothetical protein
MPTHSENCDNTAHFAFWDLDLGKMSWSSIGYSSASVFGRRYWYLVTGWSGSGRNKVNFRYFSTPLNTAGRRVSSSKRSKPDIWGWHRFLLPLFTLTLFLYSNM